ncbi:MAG TPA: hypothetical protein VG099_22055, partial [Gemmataceae bacterium]|nr:hypothetical protein [Gemmataceae bacterium]
IEQQERRFETEQQAFFQSFHQKRGPKFSTFAGPLFSECRGGFRRQTMQKRRQRHDLSLHAGAFGVRANSGGVQFSDYSRWSQCRESA